MRQSTAGISRGIIALLIKDKGGSHVICLPFVKNGGMFV
jgi:Tfp pilus assembly protein PilZ